MNENTNTRCEDWGVGMVPRSDIIKLLKEVLDYTVRKRGRMNGT